MGFREENNLTRVLFCSGKAHSNRKRRMKIAFQFWMGLTVAVAIYTKDDGIVFFRSTTNNGYSGDLEIALVPRLLQDEYPSGGTGQQRCPD